MMPPGPDRWRERSRTYEGIAQAMAAQWAPAVESGWLSPYQPALLARADE